MRAYCRRRHGQLCVRDRIRRESRFGGTDVHSIVEVDRRREVSVRERELLIDGIVHAVVLAHVVAVQNIHDSILASSHREVVSDRRDGCVHQIRKQQWTGRTEIQVVGVIHNRIVRSEEVRNAKNARSWKTDKRIWVVCTAGARAAKTVASDSVDTSRRIRRRTTAAHPDAPALYIGSEVHSTGLSKGVRTESDDPGIIGAAIAIKT